MYTIKLKFANLKFNVMVNTKRHTQSPLPELERHSNLQYELHIPLAGECMMDIEKGQFKLKRGVALLIPPGRYHSLCSRSEEYLQFVVSFQISGDENSIQIFANKVSPCSMLTLSEFDVSICEHIASEIKEQNIFWRESIYAMYSMLFNSLLRKLTLVLGDTVEEGVNYYDDRFSVIDDFFEQRLSQDCTAETLRSDIHLSKRQLNRVLKMNYGMGFRDKRLDSRMDRAQWLLRTTQLPIREICEQIGYKSETSFFKAFKKNCNMTPAEYRQMYLKKEENDSP